jgi:ribose/xylose/arabinose/galactoside ABC-type transport system permease subunit
VVEGMGPLPTGEHAPALSSRRRGWGAVVALEERGVLLALLTAFVAATLASDVFLTKDNLVGVLQNITFLGFLAVGLTFTLIAGEIDISIGSVYGLCSVVTALVFAHGAPLVFAVGAGLGVGAVAGVANGAVAQFLRVPAVIVTLAGLGIYRGLSLVLADGAPVSVDANGSFFTTFGQRHVLGTISLTTLLFLVLAAVAAFVLARTAFGFSVYAVGSNPIAARLVGMRVRHVKVGVLVISGLMAGLSGVCSVAYLGSASPTGGAGYELDALAAVIIGGSKLTGGRGTVVGTLLGLCIVGIIRNVLVLTGVSPNWQQAVAGGVLLTAVAIDRLSTGRGED